MVISKTSTLKQKLNSPLFQMFSSGQGNIWASSPPWSNLSLPMTNKLLVSLPSYFVIASISIMMEQRSTHRLWWDRSSCWANWSQTLLVQLRLRLSRALQRPKSVFVVSRLTLPWFLVAIKLHAVVVLLIWYVVLYAERRAQITCSLGQLNWVPKTISRSNDWLSSLY